MRRVWILVTFVCAIMATGQSAELARADGGAVFISGSVAVQLERFTEQQTAAGKFSGVVLVAKAGKPVVSAAYGLANRKTQTPIRMDTKFNLGSMPKMFTAVAIAQLAESGKLRFDDPIIKYLPDYPDKKVAEKVTIHQLLTHTAGFGNYFRPGFLERRLNTVKEYLALVAEDPLIGEPGAQYQYSNSGYVVLGAIVESVSRQDFYDYIRDHIFRPAGMAETAFYTREEHVDNVATGYTSGQGLMILRPGQAPPSGNPTPPAGMVTRQQGGSSSPQTSNSPVSLKDTDDMRPYRGSPAGGAYSTAGDLLKFVEALENHKLVNAHFLEMLQQGKVATRQGGPRYGYGFNEWRVAGHRIVGHGGGAPGVNAMLQIYPDMGYSVIVLSNFDPPAAEDIAAKARDLLLAGETTVPVQPK
jgi:CubicO group peptidase (beta-lactamase class C family)